MSDEIKVISDAPKVVKGVMTVDGIAAIDYESLANLPTIDDVPTNGSTNAIQSDAVYKALEGKLDANDGKAADSILFDGKTSDYYATAEAVQAIEEALGVNTEGDNAVSETITTIQSDIQSLIDTKLDKTAQAVDSAKLGGQVPSYYATATAVSDAQTTANAAQSSATTAGNNATSALTKINTLITDITAIKYVTALPSSPNSKTLYLIKKG